MRVRGLVLLGVAILGALGTAAWADTTRCDRINSVPTTINSPGVYCLDRHLGTGLTSGAAITIASDDVTLDLGGFTLAGTADPASTAIGIHAVGRQNVTIRDGTVRGFEEGISLSGGSNNLVERIRAVGNQLRGIGNVGGERNIVRHSQVLQTPGRQGAASPPSALGVGGTGSRALDNDVFGFPGLAGPGGDLVGVGIAVGGTGVVVQGNRIGNPPGAGPSFGIVVDPGSADVLVIDNRITTVGTGVDAPLGAARCRDNLFAASVTTPMDVCDSVANNN
jgi:parallel beta helix pectate lyase-like protein